MFGDFSLKRGEMAQFGGELSAASHGTARKLGFNQFLLSRWQQRFAIRPSIHIFRPILAAEYPKCIGFLPRFDCNAPNP